MIAVVAPEPAPWVQRLLRAPQALLGDAGRQPVVLFAPWRVPGWRLVDGAVNHCLRGWTPLEMIRRLSWRAAIDQAAARLLPADVRAVVAPSCGALASLAAAAHRGAAAILVEDLPLFRQLHADLDEAARRHPDCRLLGRYRAPVERVVRQEREHAVADRILVRGQFAAERHLAAGHRVRPLAAGDPKSDDGGVGAAGARDGRRDGAGPRLLLAGAPCARSGVVEALAAVTALPGAILLVRPSDAMEPAGLLSHRAVRLASPSEVGRLAGVDAVIAPAPCESYPSEVPRAAARGVPVVATRRAAGPVDLGTAGAEVEPFDVAGLVAALRRVLGAAAAAA
jgi:hypothetical protein